MDESEILTLVDVARFLHCSKAHVCNCINGKVKGVSPLPAVSLGRRKLVRRAALESWLCQNEGVL
jgi:Helix-turn-helix domain